jgi:erythronate-4-phosphate dehydrogenase
MKIICATNMPFAAEAFGTLGETTILEGRGIVADQVRDVDLLALRSTTKVNRDLLEGSKVRFVGTATIGTDHLDIGYFESAGIRWCFAPGCNANSVSEYVTSALLYIGQHHGIRLAGKTMGIIGVGNVGSRVARKARALGMKVLLNDPPRARSETAGIKPVVEGLEPGPFVGLDRILRESDIVTVHVPLTKSGEDRTQHLADDEFFGRMKDGSIFINAARGGIVRTEALVAALHSGRVGHAVLDTWESEPVYRTEALPLVDVATPHIAGHSFEGRVMGTVMVYREACKFLGVEPVWSHEPLMPPPLVPEIRVDVQGRSDEAVLWEVVAQVYDIRGDDQRFRETAGLPDAARGKEFDRQRKDYPMRREFRYTKVKVAGGSEGLLRTLGALGFGVG